MVHCIGDRRIECRWHNRSNPLGAVDLDAAQVARVPALNFV